MDRAEILRLCVAVVEARDLLKRISECDRNRKVGGLRREAFTAMRNLNAWIQVLDRSDAEEYMVAAMWQKAKQENQS